jgi:CheY-like chemotaxis protein
MDIEMPILNGVEATKKIKETLGDQAPKIVALTALTMESDRENFMAEGLDEVLSKPIEIDALHKIIAELG